MLAKEKFEFPRVSRRLGGPWKDFPRVANKLSMPVESDDNQHVSDWDVLFAVSPLRGIAEFRDLDASL